ncbi:MAG: ATP-grasp domain-containing protein [Bacteroidales bacterium]|nr:ATP-grasp domain-containing protein [Saprospiraceae bacterium]MCF8381574.1 ATP-grasp domain-containing protein [Bacteroidales bacterium]
MSKVYNILVTGIGAIIGYGIIESLRISGIACKIIGTDIYNENYGKYMCDNFVQVPLTSSNKYKTVIREIIDQFNIDLVFPGIEQDVFFFNENHSIFNTRFVINQKELIDLTKDKWLMYKYLEKVSFPNLIPTFENLDYEIAKKKFGLPFIVKPKQSYASKGFHVVDNECNYRDIENEINGDTIFQPYIGTIDEEYTVSVFGDGGGNYIDALILKRYLSKAGASEKTFVINHDDDLFRSIDKLTQIFKPVGPTNFQFRKEGKNVFLLEINARISSACSIRTKFGYNEPMYCIQHYLENRTYKIQQKRTGKAIRYIADEIIYE